MMKKYAFFLFFGLLSLGLQSQHHLLLMEATPKIKKKADAESKKIAKLLALGPDERLMVRNALMVHEVQKQKIEKTTWSPARKKAMYDRIDATLTGEFANILTRYQFNFFMRYQEDQRQKLRQQQGVENADKIRTQGQMNKL